MFAGTYPDRVPTRAADSAGRVRSLRKTSAGSSTSRAAVGTGIVRDVRRRHRRRLRQRWPARRRDVEHRKLRAAAPVPTRTPTDCSPSRRRRPGLPRSAWRAEHRCRPTTTTTATSTSWSCAAPGRRRSASRSLRNNGDGTFTDVTVASGLAKALTGTQAGVWTDIDNDGLLDLFVGNENSPAQLFRNKGDGTFEDIAEKAGVNRSRLQQGRHRRRLRQRRLAGSVRVEPRRHELPVPEQSRTARSPRVAEGARVPGPGQGFPTWFFDYDNDGLPGHLRRVVRDVR